MIAGVVDIGTNSMRLLITDGPTEILRKVVVTGLGYGVDRTGRFDPARVAETLEVLAAYGKAMDEHGVDARRAVATSATRDAADGREFVDRAEPALGVRPKIISGTEEAALSFLGATGRRGDDGPVVVIDVGGGSTEFVYGSGGVVEYATSIDIGSVRLTERVVPSRPAPDDEIARARDAVADAFGGLHLPAPPSAVLGVAGTFTSMAAIALDLPAYDRSHVDGTILTIAGIRSMIERLAALDIAGTAAIPSLDPRRAPVLLGGALVAEGALTAIPTDHVEVTESDLLDGLARSLTGAVR